MQVCTPAAGRVEPILAGPNVLGCIVRGERLPRATEFVTPSDWAQQVGFVVYPRGGEIARHRHQPVERRITGTSEVLVVRKGRCEVDFFDDDGQLVATRTIHEGDVLVLVAGGHGFRMLEDTVFLEIKQGPYTGLQEKAYF